MWTPLDDCAQELGLPVDPNIPMLGFIGRLDYQKGVDLIRDSYGFFMEQNTQVIMLGSGREDLENNLRYDEATWILVMKTVVERRTIIICAWHTFDPVGGGFCTCRIF